MMFDEVNLTNANFFIFFQVCPFMVINLMALWKYIILWRDSHFIWSNLFDEVNLANPIFFIFFQVCPFMVVNLMALLKCINLWRVLHFIWSNWTKITVSYYLNSRVIFFIYNTAFLSNELLVQKFLEFLMKIDWSEVDQCLQKEQ